MTTFASPAGNLFSIGPFGPRQERFAGDPLWFEVAELRHGVRAAGKVFRSLSYSRDGKTPRYHASTRELYWQGPAPERGGFDVAAFDSLAECLRAWGRSADEILEFRRSEHRADQRLALCHSLGPTRPVTSRKPKG